MKKLKHWIIRKLGGVTPDQLRQRMMDCEAFAKTHLYRGTVCNAQQVISDLKHDHIVVIASGTRLVRPTCRAVSVAPWCVNVSVENQRSV